MSETARLLAAARDDPGLVLLEGFHALKHALRFGADVLAAVDERPDGLARARRGSWRPSSTLEPSRRSPPAVARPARASHAGRSRSRAARAFDAGGARRRGRVVLLEDPRHLGNVGAVVRVAAAAGAAGVLTTGAARPVGSGGAARLGRPALRAAGRARRGAARPAAARSWRSTRTASRSPALPADALLAFGTERHGLSAALRARADLRVRDPDARGRLEPQPRDGGRGRALRRLTAREQVAQRVLGAARQHDHRAGRARGDLARHAPEQHGALRAVRARAHHEHVERRA